MSVSTILSITLACLQFVNWLTRQIDEAKIRGDERLKLIAAELSALNTRLGRVDAVIETGKTLTDEERKKIAMED